MQTKDSEETVKIFFQKDYKKESTKKIWVDQGTELAGEFKKFCVAEGTHVYSTISETKATFTERTIRSLKNILNRYMEEHGYKNLHKLSQFVKILNSRKSLKILHAWTVATFENFRRWPHKISLFSKQSNTFPQKQNTIAPKLPGRIHSVPKRKYSEPAPRKFARFETRASLKISKRNPRSFSGQNSLERKTKNSVNKKRTVTKKNNIPIRH